MDRAEELKRILNDDSGLFDKLIAEIIFIENQLVELRKLPFISINPRNSCQQKVTPAAKQYKELLQQYTNCLKIIAKSNGQDMEDEESPLRKWVKQKIGGD